MTRPRTNALLGAALIGATLGAPHGLPGQVREVGPTVPDTGATVRLGAFVDAYYAFDVNRPRDLDRAFTTQPARHNEFNVNLAFVEATLTRDRVRGRVALQAGTSVQANYAGEPTTGAVSGPDVSRFIQEAVAGYRAARSLWVDAGVFFSNMGMESWVSRDNPTYTRSLVADYSPYYSAGVKATWQATRRLSARLDVVNGWQNVSETNADKAVGTRLDYAVSAGAALSHYTYVGTEAGGRLRVFNGVGVKVALGPHVHLLGQLDIGAQERATGDGAATWYGGAVVGRVQVSPAVALAARVERFDDPEQVILVTGAGSPPFRATGASVGLDVAPAPGVAWRTELRGYWVGAAVFPDRSATARSTSGGVVVSSLALTF